MGFAAFWFEIKATEAQDFFSDPPRQTARAAKPGASDHTTTKGKGSTAKGKTSKGKDSARGARARAHAQAKGKGKEREKPGMGGDSSEPVGHESEARVRDNWQFVLRGRTGNGLDQAKHDLGQAVNYAVEANRRQHRHCCYSVSLSGLSARFIRWDRAGAIVSESFHLHDRPDLLCDFLWCFAKISDVERGYDLTVEPATVDDEVRFKAAIQRHLVSQVAESEHIQALDEHFQANAVTAIHLPSPAAPTANPAQGSRMLVSRPIVVPQSVTGRCTRTYWAVTSSNKVVLLKDVWRYDTYWDSPAILLEREGEVMHALKSKGVENIPEVVDHGDVPQVRLVMNGLGEPKIEYHCE